MLVTLLDVLTARAALSALSKERLPIGAALHVARLAKAAEAEGKLFEALRDKLLRTRCVMGPMGEPMWEPVDDDKGRAVKRVHFLEGEAEKFTAEMSAALAAEVEIPGGPLVADTLPDTLLLTPETVLALGPFLLETLR